MKTGTSTPTSTYDGQPSPRIDTDASDSYFPSAAATGHQTTDNQSTGNSNPALSQPAPDRRPAPVKQMSSGVGPYPLSALDRHHAPPDEELDVEKQLAKPPLPRSLHSSLRAAAATERRTQVADDAEVRAQRLAEAKKEWASWAS